MSQRYYEDVRIDDEIAPLEFTPTEDMAIDFFGRENPTNPAFRDAEAAKKIGLRGALVPGLMKLAWLTRYVTEWGGPESTLRTVRAAYRRPDIAGTPLMLAGRVVATRQEDGRNIVDLEVVILAEGQPSTRCSVEIDLPSRP